MIVYVCISFTIYSLQAQMSWSQNWSLWQQCIFYRSCMPRCGVLVPLHMNSIMVDASEPGAACIACCTCELHAQRCRGSALYQIFDKLQAQSMNAAVENLRVKQCGMLLAYSTSHHSAVTPGQTRQALLQVNLLTLPACSPVCLPDVQTVPTK